MHLSFGSKTQLRLYPASSDTVRLPHAEQNLLRAFQSTIVIILIDHIQITIPITRYP